MRVTCLGGADEVGASCFLVEAADRRLLVDAGVRISPKTRLDLAGDQLPDLSLIDRAGGVDVILLSHAHTDHSGALPLVLEHYDCPVLATPVTAALVRVLLYDAQRIMQGRLEQEGEVPLFDTVACERMLAAFNPVAFNTRIPLAEGLVATFYPAGHIAGAAMIGLESEEGRILITGDVSISPQRTVAGAKVPPFSPDALFLESTYGGRLHANRATEEARLVEAISEVVAGGGKVLIPAFALGRAQEVLLVLNAFRRRGLLDAVPVWVDGMVRSICGTYKSFPDQLPPALRELVDSGVDPFLDDYTQMVASAAERNAVAWEPGPAIIVSSSGMLAGGPSPQYARVLARDERNAILLTGYQDEESPGRRLQAVAERGEGILRLGDETVKVQCRIGTYALSAHADEDQLVSLTESLDPREVFLVHGDEPARDSLHRRLAERQRLTHRPQAGQSFELRYRSSVVTAGYSGIGRDQPLDLRRLWTALERSGGGYFTVEELARAWWGDREHSAEMTAALEDDDLFFMPDGHRSGLYRARGATQVALSEERRAAVATMADPIGHLLLVRPLEGSPTPALCVGIGPDHLHVLVVNHDAPEPLWPEWVIEDLGPAAHLPDPDAVAALVESTDSPAVADLLAEDGPQSLAVLDAAAGERGLVAGAADESQRRLVLCLALLDAGAESVGGGWIRRRALSPSRLEPNQALATARAAFPPEARLRKSGYRLADGILTLTFDFPDAAVISQADELARLVAETGWQVEVAPEANQLALGTAVREVLPEGWVVIKGPSIYREEKRVAVACSGNRALRAKAEADFAALTGYELDVTLSDRAPSAVLPVPVPSGPVGQPWEINAAYAAIRGELTGSTLYRTGLADGKVVLSFISPQVGRRYREQIDALSVRIGWPLVIGPTPNQGEIIAVAQALLADTGWAIVRGPGLHVAEAEVRVVVAPTPTEDDPRRVEVAEALLERTGYRLVLEAVTAPAPAPSRSSGAETAAVVEIPIARIMLTERQRAVPLDPEKTRRAIERVQRLGGVIEPVRVRRVADGYRVLDGLRRLEVARELGLATIPAIVEF